MSYQVLARKWRPANFGEVVGQEHVLKALINALDSERLHHAYLFSGTRGVGKTTLARIFAKSLNCVNGVTSLPCGECEACTQISEGRFVDLIEVDAASRTGIDDTRDLLDNVQYAPTSGRYKVYLIDEVHMLSNSSFNALLKTLEEPPEHVKFLFATTDPQKLPVTVLSRCLQFNLKNISSERIVEHLKQILEKEEVGFEESALWLIARSAAGSMRDALSLTDQAIAHGSGELKESEVSAMLGTIDRRHVHSLLQAIVASDGPALLQQLADLSTYSPDYAGVLEELLGLLHRIAIAQTVLDALDNSMGDRDQVVELSTQLAPEETQVLFQMALLGRKELVNSPSLRVGFEMVLLRMLAFQPDPSGKAYLASSKAKAEPVADKAAETLTAPTAAAPVQTAEPEVSNEIEEEPAAEKKPQPEPPEDAIEPSIEPDQPEISATEIETEVEVLPEVVSEPEITPGPDSSTDQFFTPHPEVIEAVTVKAAAIDEETSELTPESWIEWFQKLELEGSLRSVASHLHLLEFDGKLAKFYLDEAGRGVFREQHKQELAELLSAQLDDVIEVELDVSSAEIDAGSETPQQNADRILAERKQQAREQILANPLVQSLMQEMDARFDEDSLKLYDTK